MDLTQAFCANVPPAVVEFRLQCLVEAGRWPEASALISALSPEVRARRRITRLERRVRNNFDAGAQVEASPGEGAVTALSVSAPAETTVAEDPPAAEPAPAATPPVDPLEVERLRRRLAAAATGDELATLMGDAESLAGRHPESRQASLLAAEIAYLLADWPAAVRHFGQAGALRPGEAHLAFYRAVALYESGDRAAAAEILRPVASRLERTDFVASYVDRILAGGI